MLPPCQSSVWAKLLNSWRHTATKTKEKHKHTHLVRHNLDDPKLIWKDVIYTLFISSTSSCLSCSFKHLFMFCFVCLLIFAALVPDSVKKELLQRIRAFLAQHATLWMRCVLSRHFFTHSRATTKIWCLFSLWAMLKCCFFILYCVFSYWFLVCNAAVLERN